MEWLEARKLTTTEALREREKELALARTAHLPTIQQVHLLGISEQSLHDLIEDEPIRIDLSEQVVAAPIDGIIIQKSTTPGAPVERNAELLTIAALDHLLVEFQVPLRGVTRVREGSIVHFRTIVGGAGEGTAVVKGLVPAADSATLSAKALARLENPDGRWVAGTPVELLLDDPDAGELPSVPVGAVVEIEGRKCVFVAESGLVFRPQPVEVVAESGGRIGVKGLATENTRIVTDGASLLLAAWEAVKERLDEIRESLPSDVRIVPFYDRADLIETATSGVTTALLLGVVLVLVILGLFLFNLLNVPFAMIGGIIALALAGYYLSVPASLGFVALLGTAVMNGVVLVSYLNHLRDREGLEVEDAAHAGAERRFRPVMMTALLTVIGLVPLLLAGGPGSEIQKPLAVVVIGGTVTSTALTLLLLPAIYASLEARFAARQKG